MTAPFRKPFSAVPIKEGKAYRRKRRYAGAKQIGFPVAVLGAAAIVGAAIGVTPSMSLPTLRPGYTDTVSGCSVTDGDTIRCNGERIRLLGVGACKRSGPCSQTEKFSAQID